MKLIANEWFSLQPAGYHFNEVNTPLRMGAIPCVDTSFKKKSKKLPEKVWVIHTKLPTPSIQNPILTDYYGSVK